MKVLVTKILHKERGAERNHVPVWSGEENYETASYKMYPESATAETGNIEHKGK